MTRPASCSRRAALLLALALLPGVAAAHSFQSVYVRAVLEEPNTAEWQLRLPLDARERAAPVHLPPPPDCRRTLLGVSREAEHLLRRVRWHCEHPLPGRELTLAGLSAAFPDALLSARLPDGDDTLLAVHRDRPGFTLGDATASAPALGAYFPAGVAHILGGWDHLLFLLGLLLLIDRHAQSSRQALRRGLITVTTFTLAHSLTLATAVLGWVSLPARAVEAAIALSILLLAVELTRPRGRRGLTARAPWAVAFGIGLIHGFGFAGELAGMGLPEGSRLWALAGFNLGVEAGQIAVLLVAWLTWKALHFHPAAAPWPGRAATAALGGISAYWLLERGSAILAGA